MRSASTNSFSRSERNWARVRRQTLIQLVMPMASITFQKPAPSRAMIRKANSSVGIADMTSTIRITRKSTRPPRQPAIAAQRNADRQGEQMRPGGRC